MTPRWTFVDFVLVALGGVAGSLVVGLAALASSSTSELTLMLSMLGQFAGHLGVMWLIGRGRGLGFESLGLDIVGSDVLYLGVGVAFQIALVVLFLPLQNLLLPDGDNIQEVVEIIRSLSSAPARTLSVVVTTFLAPLTEELMFRGVLLRSMVDRPRRRVLVVTAFVFALIHLIGVASVNAGILMFLQIFLVGLVLAHVTLRTNRLGPAIFLHAGFNLLAVTILLVPEEVLEQALSSA